MANTDVLLATTNHAKQRRLAWILEGLHLNPITPGDLGLNDLVPAEEGSSHLENSQLKAQSWSRVASMQAVSSDGGLEIPALGERWRSVLTHRFAGKLADDAARLDRLLQLMQDYKGEERAASWVEALAIAEGGRTVASWFVKGATGLLLESADEGPIVPGFWVFPIWYFPNLVKTYNQLDDEELKRMNDHWSQLKAIVRRYYLGKGSISAGRG